jgi:hypothetical protein
LGQKIFETGESLYGIAQPLIVQEEIVLYDFEGEGPLPLDQGVDRLERFLDKLIEGHILRIINLRDPHQHVNFGDEAIR